jgi:tetratricopeptide (TPR) repeat protein
VQLAPENSEIRANFGVALTRAERYDEAIEQYRISVRINPALAKARLNLARLLLNRGDRDGGLHELSEAVRFDASLVDAHLLIAQIHLDRQELPETIAALRKAQKLKRDDAELARKLSWLLATSPGLSREDRGEALRLARAAIQKASRKTPVFSDTLAAALAATGQYEEAARTIRRVLAAAEQAGNAKAAAKYRERLELYESGRPYIGTAP